MRSRQSVQIVALGASAGGLEALEAFFSNVDPDTGMGFVVITHQHADRASLLAELLGRKTKMPVIEVAKESTVKPDHVYVSRPGFSLEIEHGVLKPRRIDAKKVPSMPIDRFFRSLAKDLGERAIGIVLSGTGTDGTFGVEAIKDALGLVMVQDEPSAQYAGMPHSAIATRLVDYIVAPSEMPKQLAVHTRQAPPKHGATTESLQPIFALIRARTGHDFTSYKATTIHRRIERRMTVHRIESIAKYTRYLQSNANEIDLLCKELLIGVTSFFRDPEVWSALAPPIAELLASKPAGYVFRVWVPGCSTGEEAYSLAMLLRECMEQLGRSWDVQIFATDLDSESIEIARAAVYPPGIVNDVASARVTRFFTRADEAYQVRKEIREMVVFAPHNLIADPPFTKIDLLSCRNLLIYLDADLQRRLIPLFHYALGKAGLFLLGTSETIGGSRDLFETVDQKCKIFRRKDVVGRPYVIDLPHRRREQAATPAEDAAMVAEGTVARLAERVLLRDLVPPTVLVRERGDVLYIHGRTGQFLEPAPGPQTSANIFNMARQGLQISLTSAIRQAALRHDEVVLRGIHVDAVAVDLHVIRLASPEALRGLYRITFEHVTPYEREVSDIDIDTPHDHIAELERELQYTKESHQGTLEELETANEELKSTNEELQSTNEELQSTNEELETSKEEMQSLNEELQTVNTQLQGKLDELSRVNDDMKNLLNATEIATVFIDDALRIKRFTDQAKTVIRLISSDVGRPLGDLTSSLRYDRLIDDAKTVLRTLVPSEVEIQGDNDEWYLMRILPYRTAENLIDGLVLTFVDITKSRALQLYERRLGRVLDASTTSIFGHDRQLRYRWTLGSVFGRARAELEGKTDVAVFGEAAAKPLVELKRAVLDSGRSARARIPFPVGGRVHTYELYVEPVRDDHEDITGLSCMITEPHQEA